MAPQSPSWWVHPNAVTSPVAAMFQPWPPPKDRSTESGAHGRWEVTTARSRYILDLDAGIMTRHDLDEAVTATVGASAHRDAEQMTLLAVLDCRVGRPMFLLLAMSGSGLLGTVRVTSEVSTCTLMKSPS